MKVNISKVRARVTLNLEVGGSVLAETIKARVPRVVTSYEIESPDEDSKVASVLRNARNGCWVRAAVAGPVEFEDSLTLNGEAFSFSDFPPPTAG